MAWNMAARLPVKSLGPVADSCHMSPTEERRRRRDWRSGWGRRFILTVGWLALVAANVGMVTFVLTARNDVLIATAASAIVAALSSALMPEPKQRKRSVRFAPLEGLRSARRRPSLARQLLTLP